MLWKLLKYDFRAMGKSFAILWPASLVIALINRFTIPFDKPVNNELVAIITMIALCSVLFAMGVAVMIFIVQRFYKGLLGDEGYLMHTLPVPTWQLVASKFLCAMVVTVLNGVVSVAAMLVLMPIRWSTLLQMELWQELVRAIADDPDPLLYLAEFLLLAAASLALLVTMVYLSMAIGHLFQRRRVLMSVVAFFVLDIVGTVILDLLEPFQVVLTTAEGHLALWAVTLLILLPAAVMFLATSWLLGHRLNLE